MVLCHGSHQLRALHSGSLARHGFTGHYPFRNNDHILEDNQAVPASPVDQAYEQNNAAIGGDGGAVGLTDNSNALHRWIAASTEIAGLIGEFKDESNLWS